MPTFSNAELIEAIEQKSIGAIAVDTTEFDKYDCNLQFVSLFRIDQFKDRLSVLFPEVVAGEVQAHIAQEMSDTALKLKSALNQFSKKWRLENKNKSEVLTLTDIERSPRNEAEKFWDEYVNAVGGVVVAADDVSVGELLDCYFDFRAPFENRADKKHEFPDAIALLSLESWAKKNGVLVLAVSRDQGWKNFSDKSEHLIAINDLNDAFALYNSSAQGVARKAIELLDGDKAPALMGEIENTIQAWLDDLDFGVDASSHLDFEILLQSATVQSARVASEPLVVASDDETVTFSVSIEATVDVEAEVNFSVHDSVDDDYVSLGSTYESQEHEMEFEVVATISREIQEEPDVIECELSQKRIFVNLGYVRPDWDEES